MLRLDELMDAHTIAGVRKWYGQDRLEALVSQAEFACNLWDLTPLHPLPGGRTAVVLAVNCAFGPAVLKIAPDVRRLLTEADAIAHLASEGAAPALYAVAPVPGPDERTAAAALLLERVGDGRSLRERSGPPELENAALSDLLTRVARAGTRALAQPAPMLAAQLRPLLARPHAGGKQEGPPPSPKMLTHAQRLLAELCVQEHSTWVHGSMHPGNLLWAEGRLLAIDPRPFTGDPAYDVAEVALKRCNERHGRGHEPVATAGDARTLADGAGVDSERVLAWMQVLAATGAW